MRYDLKMCLAVAFLLAMVLCSCRAVPVRTQEEANDALQRIIDRLLARHDLPQNIREDGYERNIRNIGILERERRGGSRSPTLRGGPAFIPIDSLRRQYEEERRRRLLQEQNQKNQKYFESIG